MPRKQTSPDLSTIASKYVSNGRDGIARLWDRDRETTITEILACMASLLGQDETKGQGGNTKA